MTTIKRTQISKLDEIRGDIDIIYTDLDVDSEGKPRWIIYCIDESQKMYDISCGLFGVSAILGENCEYCECPLGVLLDRMEEEPREVGTSEFWWHTVCPKLISWVRYLFATYEEG